MQRRICHLGSRMAQDVFAVGVKSHGPKTHIGHELLGDLELAIAAEDGKDEFAAAVLAHGDLCRAAALLLRCSPHVALADLQQLIEALPESLTGLEEFIDQVTRGLSTNPTHALLGSLDLAGKLYE